MEGNAPQIGEPLNNGRPVAQSKAAVQGGMGLQLVVTLYWPLTLTASRGLGYHGLPGRGEAEGLRASPGQRPSALAVSEPFAFSLTGGPS